MDLLVVRLVHERSFYDSRVRYAGKVEIRPPSLWEAEAERAALVASATSWAISPNLDMCPRAVTVVKDCSCAKMGRYMAGARIADSLALLTWEIFSPLSQFEALKAGYFVELPYGAPQPILCSKLLSPSFVLDPDDVRPPKVPTYIANKPEDLRTPLECNLLDSVRWANRADSQERLEDQVLCLWIALESIGGIKKREIVGQLLNSFGLLSGREIRRRGATGIPADITTKRKNKARKMLSKILHEIKNCRGDLVHQGTVGGPSERVVAKMLEFKKVLSLVYSRISRLCSVAISEGISSKVKFWEEVMDMSDMEDERAAESALSMIERVLEDLEAGRHLFLSKSTRF